MPEVLQDILPIHGAKLMIKDNGYVLCSTYFFGLSASNMNNIAFEYQEIYDPHTPSSSFALADTSSFVEVAVGPLVSYALCFVRANSPSPLI
ncbi:hypothetical protein V6N13_064916 [Hibiscus sabdariffa]|uniref:Uncharacterized protein n=1 Tax=Hibiscus sabdariffa TaxID=183260 RepID=A0ABR2EF41_9ROSI